MDSEDLSACSSTNESDDSKEDDFSQVRTKLGEYLSTQYGVLVKVLKCLTAKDLKSATKVCRSWESAGKILMASQAKLKWLFYHSNHQGWNIPPQLATYTAICEHIYFEPDVCLCFISKKKFKEQLKCDIDDVPCPATGSAPCQKSHLFTEYIASFLGPQCRLLAYPVSGVVSTNQDLSDTWEVESFERQHYAMSTVFFPKIKGVTTVPFSLNREQQSSLIKGSGSAVDVVDLLNLPRNETVHAVVIFSGYAVASSCPSALLSKLQERQDLKIALGGGIMEKSHNFEGIVFCGPNVCAASIILPQDCVEKEHVQEAATKLKNCSLPSENSLAFVFACLGRGAGWYNNEPRVESSILRKTLPNTPIIGFFGKGEIGTVSLPNFRKEMREGSPFFWGVWKELCSSQEEIISKNNKNNEPPNKVPKRSEPFDVNHSYSTSIVLLSFNASA